jgi:methionine aminotransferase
MQPTQLSLNSKLPGIELSIFSVMTSLAQQHNAINLAQGFPDFNCPELLVDFVCKQMASGNNQYAPMPGVRDLREQIATKVMNMYGANYDVDTEITITAGATQAIYTAITTIVKEKEEVLVFEPAYDSYLPSILLAKGAPKYVTLTAPDYRVNWDQVKKLITARTRLIIINTPHNPTGMIFSHEDMVQLQKIIANKDIFVISDEVYEHIIFDGNIHQSAARYPELACKTFIISSFGKTYHATGWKTGYVLAPKELTEEFRKVYTYEMFSAVTPIQNGYAEMMAADIGWTNSLPDFYQRKRDVFLESISKSRFKPVPCNGTYFQCLDYSDITDEHDRKFAEHLTTVAGVASIPTSVFYHDKIDQKILRFCFAKNEETLKEAGARLCKI